MSIHTLSITSLNAHRQRGPLTPRAVNGACSTPASSTGKFCEQSVPYSMRTVSRLTLYSKRIECAQQLRQLPKNKRAEHLRQFHEEMHARCLEAINTLPYHPINASTERYLQSGITFDRTEAPLGHGKNEFLIFAKRHSSKNIAKFEIECAKIGRAIHQALLHDHGFIPRSSSPEAAMLLQ